MKYCKLFDAVLPQDCDKPRALVVGDSNFKDHYPGVNRNMAWCTLEPFIRQAQDKYVKPYICDILCCIADKIEQEKELTDIENCILTMLRDAIAYYAMYHAMPILNTVIADMGVQESSSSEGVSNPSSMWRYKNTRWSIISYADCKLDELLSYIEALPGDDEFSIKFLNSKCYQKNCWFNNTADFQNCIDIRNSRRTFLALIPYIKKAAHKYLKPIICQKLFSVLCEKQIKDELNFCDKQLIELIQNMLSNFALVLGIPKMRVVIEDDGIKTCSSSDGFDFKSPAYLESINMLCQQAEEEGNYYIAEIWKFLCENEDKYPEWTTSECYPNSNENDCPCIETDNSCGGIML